MVDAAVLAAVREVLSDPGLRAGLLGAIALPPQAQDTLDLHTSQLNNLLSDSSIGRISSSAQWISGVSVLDGTITANNINVNSLNAINISTGDLNVTGTVKLAASFPAVGQRIDLSSTGILGYNSGVTNTYKLNTDGSGFVGVGGTAMSWTTAGVVTIPVASIGSLTIAAVGGGVLGGIYQTATVGQHINLSTSGIVAYNATSEIAANETFRLNATTGAMTATGSFTIKSASSGSHVTLDNAGGIAGYNGTSEVAGNRTFLFNAATGAGHIGLSTGTPISWDAAGTLTVNGSLLVNGTVIANAITSGTFTGGATINFGTADVVVNSTGKLKFGTSNADYLANDKLHFEVGSSDTAKVEIKNGSSTYSGQLSGSSGASASAVVMAALTSGNAYGRMDVQNSTTNATNWARMLAYTTGGSLQGGYTVSGDGQHLWQGASDYVMKVVAASNDLSMRGRFYPGTGTAEQSTAYIDWNTTVPARIRFSGDLQVVGASWLNTNMNYPIVTSGGSGALPNPTKYIQVNNATGTTAYFIPVFTAVAGWAA